jgi:hypothetical protein
MVFLVHQKLVGYNLKNSNFEKNGKMKNKKFE